MCIDYRELNRPKLHPFTSDDGKTYMPTACHTMSNEEKTNFLMVIRNLRVLKGYASTVSRCVCLKERTISGLKSHDSHIIMQQLLLIALCCHCQIMWLDLLLRCLHSSGAYSQ
jgi:hypothetical protein